MPVSSELTGAGGVRPARPEDAAAVAAVQLAAWSESLADVAPVHALVPDHVAGAWRAAIEAPPSDRHHVLVSEDEGIVVGFAALAPCGDPDAAPTDGEVVALEVVPLHRRGGHGSRLLNAVGDVAGRAGFRRLLLWVPEEADAVRQFVTGAGLAPDGARRVAATDDGARMAQVRLSASIDA